MLVCAFCKTLSGILESWRVIPEFFPNWQDDDYDADVVVAAAAVAVISKSTGDPLTPREICDCSSVAITDAACRLDIQQQAQSFQLDS